MQRMLQRFFQAATNPRRWRTTQTSLADETSLGMEELSFPRRQPLAFVLAGVAADSPRVAAALAARTLRARGGAVVVDATIAGDGQCDLQANAIADAVDERRNLVVAARFTAAAAYDRLLTLLQSRNYRVITVIVAPSVKERNETASRVYAATLCEALSALQRSSQRLLWLVPRNRRQTRQANRFPTAAVHLLGGESETVDAQGNNLPLAGTVLNSLLRQRTECLQILRRRAAEEKAACE